MVEILSKFSGIIGTLLGVAMTLILTQLLKRGKLHLYSAGLEVNFTKYEDGRLGSIDLDKEDEAQYASFDFELDLYNNSEIPKALRNFRFIFSNGSNVIYEVTPEDNSTTKRSDSGLWTTRDNFKVFNLKQKSIERLSFHLTLGEDQVSKIIGYKTLKLKFEDYKGKSYSIVIQNRT